MKQKKIIAVLTGGAMLAGMLTGCGVGTGKSDDPVNLTVWTYYNVQLICRIFFLHMQILHIN